MLLVRYNDFIVFDPAARLFDKAILLHSSFDILDLRAVQRIFTKAKLKSIVFWRVVARCDLYSAVGVEMEQREIKQRCRTDTDVDDLQTGRNQPGYDSLGVTIGG